MKQLLAWPVADVRAGMLIMLNVSYEIDRSEHLWQRLNLKIAIAMKTECLEHLSSFLDSLNQPVSLSFYTNIPDASYFRCWSVAICRSYSNHVSF